MSAFLHTFNSTEDLKSTPSTTNAHTRTYTDTQCIDVIRKGKYAKIINGLVFRLKILMF